MMKKIMLIAMLLIGFSAFAQTGSVKSVAVDTLKGAETVNFTIGTFTGHYETLAIQALCTQLGGTSDGTLTLYGSVDGTSYSFVNGVGGMVIASPKASNTGTDLNQITITNGLVASWIVKDVPFKYYKITGVGTSSDTTKVTIKYIYK